ncbi:hypothetical protein AGMMS49982_13040 [Bacteroidia bacterium]|nr:hypothetical protein AGMMS49982_13040 [Bacteroidia bacterium]
MKKGFFLIICLFSSHFAFAQTVPAKAYVVPIEGDTVFLEEYEEFTIPPPKSAPVEIYFEATSENESAGFIWTIFEIDRDTREKKPNPITRTTQSFTDVFQRAGLFQIWLETVPDTESIPCFSLNIDEADLKLPNTFSPNGDGVNDIYKVSSKSIVRSKVSIYNRLGKLLYSWRGESLKDWEGWDGKVNGKYVQAGVYFIIIDATGADGRVYKLSSDINVLR